MVVFRWGNVIRIEMDDSMSRWYFEGVGNTARALQQKGREMLFRGRRGSLLLRPPMLRMGIGREDFSPQCVHCVPCQSFVLVPNPKDRFSSTYPIRIVPGKEIPHPFFQEERTDVITLSES